MTIRPPSKLDAKVLVGARDAEFHRFMGEGSAGPKPTAVGLDSRRRVVGSIDCDTDRTWLVDGEVNIGYSVFPDHRGHGFAQRLLALLISFLGQQSQHTTATLLIDPENAPSIAVARRAHFSRCGEVNGQLLYSRPLSTPGGLSR